jgi:hypothetical protein
MEGWTAPRIFAVLVLSFAPSLSAAPQAPTPQISIEPLTAAELDVYRTLLVQFTYGSDRILILAPRTEPLQASDGACLKRRQKAVEISVPVVHQLDSAVFPNTQFALADPDFRTVWKREIALRYPDRAVPHLDSPFIEEIDDWLMRELEGASQITLSEILFDKKYRQAVVASTLARGGYYPTREIRFLRLKKRKWEIDNCLAGGASSRAFFR